MNERIKELLKQSRRRASEIHTPGSGAYENLVFEKFALLILKECIDQISVNHDPNSDWDWEVSRGHAIAIIKEHFGVENDSK